MYVDYEFYTSCYADLPESSFDRFAYMASRILDRYTSGVDGVRKLKVAFPEDEEAVMAVRLCAARVIFILHQLEKAEKESFSGTGYVQTDNGLQGKVITSIHSGNESISFTAGGPDNSITRALADSNEKDKLLQDTVREYLSGICDKNGVGLLFMGPYPMEV